MSKAATTLEKSHLGRVASLGCIVKGCCAPATIHHCGTYMGGGRDHRRVIPLCWEHHLGAEGIDGKRMGKRQWEAKYGTEEQLLEQTEAMLRLTWPQHYPHIPVIHSQPPQQQ